MEHLQEIRILRQRLEYSIKTNERLRKQLERQVTDKELDQGKNSFDENTESIFPAESLRDQMPLERFGTAVLCCWCSVSLKAKL